jgi:hypothetical protein
MAAQKSVAVSFGIKTNERFNDVAKKAYVKVSAADIDTITRPMTITDSMLYGTVENIPVGEERLFEILVYDSLQHLQYYGFQSVDLQIGVVTKMVIYIGRIAGPVEIIGVIKDTGDSVWYPDTMPPWHPDDTVWYPDTMPPWHPDDTVWHPDTMPPWYPDTVQYPDTFNTGVYPDTFNTGVYPDTFNTGVYPDTFNTGVYPDTPGVYIDTTVWRPDTALF